MGESQSLPKSKYSPEMIDAAVIQLDSMFNTDETIPVYVRDAGKEFVKQLNRWSDETRNK